jgi:ribosomal protein L12E/L44/L45/RPP1/RPP2
MKTSAEEQKSGSDPNSPQLVMAPKTEEKPSSVLSPRLPKSYQRKYMDEAIKQNILNTLTKTSGDVQAQNDAKSQKKGSKHKLEDNDELLEYIIDPVDGKRKKKIIRRVKKVKALSEEEVQEIYAAFNLFDKDGSGTIDSHELKDAMKALGIYVNKTSLKKYMQKADKDGSGTIEKGEFLSLMAEMI